MKRTLSLVLVLAMVFSAMLGVVSFAAEDTTPKALEVSQANLEFASAVYLYFAVDYSDFGSADGVTLSVKFGDKEVILTPDSSITAPSNCVAFKYTQLGAQNMGDELVLQALKDGVASGEPKNYSILEYALKAQANGDEKFTALMDAMLQYGMDAQKAFKHTGDYDLSQKYSLVVPKGGALADGKSKALVALGSSVTVTKAGNAADTIWYNSAIQKIGTGASLSIKADKTYYSMFCAPAAVATGYVFDMDTYTGDPVVPNLITTDVKSNQLTINVNGENYKVGNFITNRTDTNEGYALATPGYAYIYNPSAITSIAALGETQFKAAMSSIVSSQSQVFTISLTVATKAGCSGVMSLYLRNGASSVIKVAANGTKGTSGRVALMQSTGATLTDWYSADAKNVDNKGYNNLVTVDNSNANGPGAYTTIHIVIDIPNDRMRYYNADGVQVGKDIVLPVPASYFSGAKIEHYSDKNEAAYIKSLVVTHCNIADYLK